MPAELTETGEFIALPPDYVWLVRADVHVSAAPRLTILAVEISRRAELVVTCDTLPAGNVSQTTKHMHGANLGFTLVLLCA